MESNAVNYRISLEFWSSTDVVLTVGPLQITSSNTDEWGWGYFEILWNGKYFLYCHLLEDCDPYNGRIFGPGMPEWEIGQCGSKPGFRTLWTSLQWFGPIHARFDLLINRLRGS